MTRWFVDYATDADIARLEEIQSEIEATGFDDPDAYSVLDQRFHRVVYDRHYNRHAADMWWRHREILRAIGNRIPFSRARRQAILHEHREMIACVRRQDGEGAARIIAEHVEGSGRHLIEQMRAARARGAAPGRKAGEQTGAAHRRCRDSRAVSATARFPFAPRTPSPLRNGGMTSFSSRRTGRDLKRDDPDE